jgi:hypothetical protein
LSRFFFRNWYILLPINIADPNEKKKTNLYNINLKKTKINYNEYFRYAPLLIIFQNLTFGRPHDHQDQNLQRSASFVNKNTLNLNDWYWNWVCRGGKFGSEKDENGQSKKRHIEN